MFFTGLDLWSAVLGWVLIRVWGTCEGACVCVQERLSKRERKSCRSFCWRRQIGSSSLSFYIWFVFLASIYNPARYVILCLLFFFGSPPSFSFPSLVLLALKQSVLRCVICIFLMVYGCVEPLVGGGSGGSVFGLWMVHLQKADETDSWAWQKGWWDFDCKTIWQMSFVILSIGDLSWTLYLIVVCIWQLIFCQKK